VPVDPVLGEVDVLGGPLLALPELVQLFVAEEVDLAAIGGLEHGGVTGGLEVLALHPLGDVVAHGSSLSLLFGPGLDRGARVAEPSGCLAGQPA
jgi:hypothetical protein